MRGEGGAGGGAEGRVGEVVNGRARMDWVVAIRRRKLMENPHFETGSQDEVVILQQALAVARVVSPVLQGQQGHVNSVPDLSPAGFEKCWSVLV